MKWEKRTKFDFVKQQPPAVSKAQLEKQEYEEIMHALAQDETLPLGAAYPWDVRSAYETEREFQEFRNWVWKQVFSWSDNKVVTWSEQHANTA